MSDTALRDGCVINPALLFKETNEQNKYAEITL